MESALQLSLEQEFNLRAFRQQVETLSSDEKTQYLMEIIRQLMIKNNVIQHLISPAEESMSLPPLDDVKFSDNF